MTQGSTYRAVQFSGSTSVGVLDLDYSFDPVGNLVGVADHFDGTRSQTIDYDLLDRVIDASGPYGNLSFSYDESGNRLTKTSGIGVDAYVYSPTSNRLEEIAGATSELFGYDENGNVTASAAGEYTYDDSNRLVAFSTAGIDATYQYNADGERVTKTVNGVVTRFRYAEGLLIGEYDVDGNPIREYAYLDGQPLAVFMYESGAIGQLVDRTVDNTVAMLDGAWSSSTSVSGFVGSEYLYHAPALNNPDRVVVDNGDPDFSSTGAWTGSTAVSGYEGGDYLYHPANAGPSGGVIVDDLGAGVATTGQWNQSTSVGGYIGSGYSHHAAGTGTSSVTWPVAQAQSGQYDVYARWTSHANRASNAKYTVLHSGGATDVTVDQRQNGGQWVLLGSFTLDGNSQVTLTDEGDGYVVADGIQVVPVGAPANLAQWDLPVATAGTYRVYARWTSHSNRASNATYVVTDTLGETSIAVDQRTNGGQWNLLGVFNLDASSRVVVSDVADGNVIADAVMIEPVASVTTPYVASWPIDAIPGQYEVFARWTSHPNRASNATYTVHHAGGQTAISVDQRQGGGQWQSLGSYELNGSSVVSVDTDVDGYVIADAVRIVGSMPSPQSSTTYYVHNNPLGAAQKMTDAAGYVVWDVDRAPFGEINLISSAVDLPLRFPGQYFDDETGLHYNYYRDYEPATGRYIQSDPIGLKGGLNTYAYAGGNPLKLIDPKGLDVVIGANGPVMTNPFGHTAQAFSGRGVYSFGTVHGDGSSFSKYVLDQASQRDSTYYIFSSNAAQDLQMIAAYKRRTDHPYDKFENNCASVTSDVLKAGDVNTDLTTYLSSRTQVVPATLLLELQRLTLGLNAGQQGISVISVPKGSTTVPLPLQKFDPLP